MPQSNYAPVEENKEEANEDDDQEEPNEADDLIVPAKKLIETILKL